MDSSGAGNGDFARILSSDIAAAHRCSSIVFYYHMYGDDIGSLNLYLVSDPPPYEYDNPIWGLSGNQGNKWQKGEVNITYPLNYKVTCIQLLTVAY